MRTFLVLVSLSMAAVTLDARNHGGGHRGSGTMRGNPGMSAGAPNRIDRGRQDRIRPGRTEQQQQQRQRKERQTQEQQQRRHERSNGANTPRNGS
jgi:hypothetical protein